MSDDTDSGGSWSSWSPPSYSLGGPSKDPGLSTGNLGDYQLGTGLGTTGPGGDSPGPHLGSGGYSPEMQKQLLDNIYKAPEFSLSQMGFGTINSPLLGENEKVNWQNLGVAQKDLAKLPQITFGSPEASGPATESPGWFEPGSKSYAWGLRAPGTPEARDFFSHETGSERDTRMGLVDNALGTAANTVMGMMMPAPVKMAMGGYNALQSMQNGGTWRDALTKALSGVGGYGGAAGQLLQGNYGSALTGALTKEGANPLVSMTTGTALDAARGKNVIGNLGQIAGYALGKQQGGLPGAALGSFAGRSLANIFGKNK